jgi:ribonuclease HI
VKLNVWTDGSITGGAWGKKNEKGTTPHGWSGWVIKREDGIVVQHHSLDLGAKDYMSGNVAEYMGLRSALAWLIENHFIFNLEIFADSQLIINQMTGAYNVHDAQLKFLHDECQKLAYNFPRVTYTWIPRELNKEADVLSKGYQLWNRVPTWEEVQDTLRKGWK